MAFVGAGSVEDATEVVVEEAGGVGDVGQLVALVVVTRWALAFGWVLRWRFVGRPCRELLGDRFETRAQLGCDVAAGSVASQGHVAQGLGECAEWFLVAGDLGERCMY